MGLPVAVTRAATLLATIACVMALSTGSASAVTPAAGWTLDTFAAPHEFSTADNATCLSVTAFDDEKCDRYTITATDAGALSTTGAAITLAADIPAQLTVQGIELHLISPNGREVTGEELGTGVGGNTGDCSLVTVECVVPGPVAPDQALQMNVFVTVDEPGAAANLHASATVSGGGAPSVSDSTNNLIGTAPPTFGIANFSSLGTAADGLPDTQAGDHPYELTTRIGFNSDFRDEGEGQLRQDTSVEDVRDVVIDLPVGFLGSAIATPSCTFAELGSDAFGGVGGCPVDTVVGAIRTRPAGTAGSVGSAIYNMVPEKGFAAEFGFVDILGFPHALYARVIPGPDGYRLQVTSPEITQIALTDVVTTFFGDPAAKIGSGDAQTAQFTNPSTCSGDPLVTEVHVDSWQHPGKFNADGTPDLSDPHWASASSTQPPVQGCNLLQFTPALSATPETSAADSPTGLSFDLRVPQSESFGSLATPPLRNASVTLPAGFTVNPASAGGLEACTLAQIALQSAAAPSCPAASQIGTVHLTTPVLAGTLEGEIYLATEFENPFNSLLAAYIVVNDPRTGVIVKIPGELKTDPTTGQTTGVFDNNPQFPFSDLKLKFKGGSRGVLATPQACGTYVTTSDLAPWSAPDSGPLATPSSSFEINGGVGGGTCAAPGFAPSFAAGSLGTQAAGFTPFSVAFSRKDGEQTLGRVSVTMPPGLLGILKNVVQCPEPQAQKGECGPESLIGEATAAVGAGPEPYWVKGGRVYLTGPYNNGPFGLSVVVPTTAGPFTLTGNAGYGKEVVRSSIRVNPITSQITVVSDPLPTIIEGIPLKIKTVNVTINRANFIFNPTGCNQGAVAGLLTSAEGAAAPVSSNFQAANCVSLAFKPGFKVSTNAKTSKASGASLHVNIVYPTNSQGTQSNIAKVRVELPKALPARLTTLQKACTEQQFAANPAGCPSASVVGHAIAHTPILNNPLEGPAYFVSHGGAAFPELILVLQGEGVTIDLAGETFINSKADITSSTFKSVPDAPISSFELTLPQGPFSALAANGDLCDQQLLMPTQMTGQNGATLDQATRITVEGCGKTLSVVSARVNKKTLKLSVFVPGAGKVTASGKGVSSGSKSYSGVEAQTFTLTQKKAGKLETKIKLTFTPSKGKKQSKTLSVKFKK